MVVQEWFPVLTEMTGNKFFNLRKSNENVTTLLPYMVRI